MAGLTRVPSNMLGSGPINYLANPGAEGSSLGWVTCIAKMSAVQSAGTVDTTGNMLNFTASGFYVGMRVRFASTVTAPGGLTTATDYYVHSLGGGGATVGLAATPGGAQIDLTSVGSGTMTLIPYEPGSGTGTASSGFTFTQTTASPLNNTASLLISKAAANHEMELGYLPFTIARKHRYSKLKISFNYEIASGTYADGDVKLSLYDVTNDKNIQPTGHSIYNTTVGGIHQAEFQTTDSTSYRLQFYVGSTSAVAFTMKVDDLEVTPQMITRGVFVGDWVDEGAGTITAITTSPTKGTIVVDKMLTREVGDTLEVKYTLHQSAGSAGAGSGDYLFHIPSRYTIDTTKTGADASASYGTGAATGAKNAVGLYAGRNGNQSHYGKIFVYDSNKVRTFGSSQGATSNAFGALGSGVLPLSTIVSYDMQFSVPLLGRSSNQVLSSQESGRLIAARAYRGAGTNLSVTANVTMNLGTTDYNHAGGYNNTTGEFTCPEPGLYEVNVEGIYFNNNTYVNLYKNGVYSRMIFQGHTSTVGGAKVELPCNAGDVLSLRPHQTTTLLWASTYTAAFTFRKINSPAQLVQVSTIACSYSTTAAQSIANNTRSIIDFGTKDFDYRGSVTTGASWKFTASESGLYEVNASMLWASANVWGTTEAMALTVHVDNNATPSRYLYYNNGLTGGGSSVAFPMQGTCRIRLIAGQYIDIRALQVCGSSLAMDSTAGMNYVEIMRVGDY